ncbi:phage virion morphogenesis protein [uncultured Desulfovibrio sp.]|uniref:phage virion morphogenesis protein n=1 Tax=uncultured Desulfovibrio sp. TaxID=167968 RepID=UPI002620BEE6|nr:phage virion morphogenesis protein [uncultured Desulfovibrio sp.]
MAGATLEFRFTDEELRRATRQLRDRLARIRFRPLLTAIGNELVTSVSRRFETATAPDGSRWPQSLRVRREGGQTLVKTARLRDSISRAGPQVTARSVEVGTNVEYADIHQFGATIPPHTIRARRARALRIPGIGCRRQVRHPGGLIPARPFLGLSAQDETIIQDMTEDWLRNKIAGMRR